MVGRNFIFRYLLWLPADGRASSPRRSRWWKTLSGIWQEKKYKNQNVFRDLTGKKRITKKKSKLFQGSDQKRNIKNQIRTSSGIWLEKKYKKSELFQESDRNRKKKSELLQRSDCKRNIQKIRTPSGIWPEKKYTKKRILSRIWPEKKYKKSDLLQGSDRKGNIKNQNSFRDLIGK